MGHMDAPPSSSANAPRRRRPPPSAASVLARLWVPAEMLFLRESARLYSWLWLLRADGGLSVWRLPRQVHGDDRLLPALARPDERDDPARGWRRLPYAPVVPVPRWSVSWGHPWARQVQAFAAVLAQPVLDTLGALESAGAYLGCAENYSRLATLPEPVRTHRLQALALFPPMVAPLLLVCPERPQILDDDGDEVGCDWSWVPAEVLDAIDRGRDLIGTLARYYGVSRALVRLPMMRQAWPQYPIGRRWLLLLDALPPQQRPRSREELHQWQHWLNALPLRWRNRAEAQWVARGLSPSPSDLWASLCTRWPRLDLALRDSADFLRAAAVQVAQQDPQIGLDDIHSLALAWMGRLGLRRLLLASQRWHDAPETGRPSPKTVAVFPAHVDPLLGEHQDDEGTAIELTTERALADEGANMRHCAGSYWLECVRWGKRFFHLQGHDGEQATASFDLEGGEDPRYVWDDCRGPRNAEVSEAMEALAMRVLDALNDDTRCEARRRVADEAARWQSRWRQAMAMGAAWRKPLDAQSQRELQRVLAFWSEHVRSWQGQGQCLRTPVAGLRYHDGRHLLARLHPGDVLRLQREPDNPHDPLAVRVYWGVYSMGYLPRSVNAPIARAIDQGATLVARVEDIDPDAPLHERLLIVVECPDNAQPMPPAGGTESRHARA